MPQTEGSYERACRFLIAAGRVGTAPLPGNFDGSCCFGRLRGSQGKLEHATKTGGEAAEIVGVAGAVHVEPLGIAPAEAQLRHGGAA